MYLQKRMCTRTGSRYTHYVLAMGVTDMLLTYSVDLLCPRLHVVGSRSFALLDFHLTYCLICNATETGYKLPELGCPEGGSGPSYVAYIFVFLGSIISWRLYKVVQINRFRPNQSYSVTESQSFRHVWRYHCTARYKGKLCLIYVM
jgi:hypothetical protein